MSYYLILGAIFLVSWLVSNRLKSKFEYYSHVQLRNGMSGKEIAEKMLRDNGIYDVNVISIPGRLTDHYNPLATPYSMPMPIVGLPYVLKSFRQSISPLRSPISSLWPVLY